MTIETTKDGGKMTLVLEGRLDTTTADTLNDALKLDGVTDLTLDLAKVPYMSSAGLRCLLTAHKKMSATGGKMRLAGVEGIVKEVLEMTGFLDFFETI